MSYVIFVIQTLGRRADSKLIFIEKMRKVLNLNIKAVYVIAR